MEFFLFENELWFRDEKETSKLSEDNYELIQSIADKIEEFYPEAYKSLSSEYNKCSSNITFFRYKIVLRFCKCNFGTIDNVPDIDFNGKFNLEHVTCPLRGECKYENIVCSAKFNSNLSPAEIRVLKLFYQNKPDIVIAELLYISIHTVKNHIRNAMLRLDIHTRRELMKYLSENKIFK